MLISIGLLISAPALIAGLESEDQRKAQAAEDHLEHVVLRVYMHLKAFV